MADKKGCLIEAGWEFVIAIAVNLTLALGNTEPYASTPSPFRHFVFTAADAEL